MNKYVIFVFANLKPSQIQYKLIPLSKSKLVEKVYVLRKTPLNVGEEKIQCMHLPRLLRIRPLYWFFTAFYGIILIKRKKANLILSYNIFPHGFNGAFASLFTRLPVIFSEINEDTINYHKSPFSRLFIKAILSNATHIIVPGSNTASYWKNNGFIKLYNLHSTINTDYFSPDTSINKIHDFIFIGEFDDNKRPDMILEAFNRLRNRGINATMCMIGYGSLVDRLKKIIANNGLDKSVSLIETNSVLEYLQLSKIFVMASISEGIPCALLESMACELIPIVPDVGDISDVVRHGYNGFIHNGSINSLENLMKDILIQYDDLKSIRASARNTIISEHSYEVATAKWDNLLSKIK